MRQQHAAQRARQEPQDQPLDVENEHGLPEPAAAIRIVLPWSQRLTSGDRTLMVECVAQFAPTPPYSTYSTISREPGYRVLRSRWSVYEGKLPGPRYLAGGRAPRRPALPAAGETERTFGTAAGKNCTGTTQELRRFVFCFACGMRCWSVVRFKSIQHSNPGKWRLVSGLTARVGKKIYI